MSMVFRKFCLMVIMIITPSSLVAADGNHLDYSPKTPEAWSFQQLSDIPVGNYTGTLDFSIPLYTIECGDIKVPVSLDYLGSAIRVDQEATWVGLNWALNAGGAITTRLSNSYDCSNGIPDGWKAEWRHLLNYLSLTQIYPTGEYNYKVGYKFDGMHPGRGGYGKEWFKKTFEIVDTTNFPNDIPYHLYSIILDRGDGESPTYQATFLGHHVSFIYDRLAGEYFITGNADGFKVSNGGAGPTITDRNGFRYFFDTVETGYYDDASVNPETQHFDYTYYLTRIESPTGRNVYFNYRDEHSQHSVYKIQETLYSDEYPYAILSDKLSQSQLNRLTVLGGNTPTGAGSMVLRTHTPQYIFQPKRLSSIETDAGLKVVFNPDTDTRLDMRDVDHSLKSIEIYVLQPDSSYQLLKRFRFQYSYFSKNTTGGNTVSDAFGTTYASWFSNDDFMYYRLRLDRVWEETVEGTTVKTMPAYSFGYSLPNLPCKASAAIDYWGYYNGKENYNGTYHTMLPKGWDEQTDDDASLFPDNRLTVFGADRRPDGNCAKACMLTSVAFPTGATAQFTYEPNTFRNYKYFDTSLPAVSGTEIPEHFDTRTVYASNQPGYSAFGTYYFKEQTSFAISDSMDFSLEISYSKSDLQSLSKWSKIFSRPALIQRLNSSGGIEQTFTYMYAPSDTALSTSYLRKSFDVSLSPGTYKFSIPALDTTDRNEAFYQITARLIQVVAQEGETGTTSSPDYSGSGVRVKSVRIINDGAVTTTSYDYTNDNGASSGKLMARPVYAREKVLIYQSESFQNIGGNLVYPPMARTINYWLLSGDNLATTSRWNVSYSRVTVSKSGSGLNNGRSIYNYHNHRWGSGSMWDFMRRIEDPRDGMLLNRYDYDSNNQLIRSTTNAYEMTCVDSRLLNAVVENTYYGGNSVTGGNELASYNAYSEVIGGGIMMIYLYPSVQFAMKTTTNVIGDYVDGVSMEKSLSTTYNLRNNLDSLTVESHSRTDETTVTETLYPTDYTSNSIASSLMSRHIIGVPMEQAVSVTDADGTRVAEDTRTTYNTMGQPTDIYRLNNPHLTRQSLTMSNVSPVSVNHEKEVTVSYNTAHQPRTVTTNSILTVTYIWGYSNQFPIAVVEGASESQIIAALGGEAAVTSLESAIVPTQTPEQLYSTLSAINGAIVTVYEHQPHIGVVRKIAPNGEQTTFDYDSFGRLVKVTDHNGTVTGQFQYHYRNE